MKAETPLYQQLADSIADQIRAGLYEPGDRLPSARQLARRETVSISTALSAYEILEQRRLAEARPQSGYYILASAAESLRKPIERAAPLPAFISPALMDMINLEPHIRWNFACAIPTHDMPMMRQMQRGMRQKALKRNALPNGYGPSQGTPELRKQVALRALDAGLNVSADDIIITQGCQQAITLALRVLTRPGDIVALESPCYYGFIQLCESFGLNVMEIPTCPREGMDLELLEEAAQRHAIKVVISVPSLSNPLGSVMPLAKRQRLAAMLNRHDMYLIEDDVYGELWFRQEDRLPAIKSFDAEGRVLLCSSLSKTLHPQLRVGWIIPGRFHDQILYQKHISVLSSPALTEMVAAEVMARGKFDRHLRHCRDIYRRQMEEFSMLIAKYFPQGTRVTRPQGGMVLWVELPRAIDTAGFYGLAKEQGILFSPGELYSLRGCFRHCLRLCYSQPLDNERRDAIRQLGMWAVEQQLERVVTDP